MDGVEILKILGALLPVLITGLIGYFQYLNQKNTSQYSENLKNLYSTKKEEVLSSIANLVTFKNKSKLRRISQDILINRIYTELDYNICNAIGNQLVSMVDEDNPGELKYIVERLIDINYNYFLQYHGIKGRKGDVSRALKEAEKNYVTQLQNKDNELVVPGLEEDHKIRVKQKWEEFTELKDLQEYKILWHKQIIADTLGMILSRATKMNFKDIVARFIANDFNFCTFRNITIHQCSMEKSAFGASIFQQVKMNNVHIDDNDLSRTIFEDCTFSKGIIRATTFHGSRFYRVRFEDIQFDDVCFVNAEFVSCSFVNVSGLKPEYLYFSVFRLNPSPLANGMTAVTPDTFTNWLLQSKFAAIRIEDIEHYIINLHASQTNKERPEEVPEAEN